MASNTPNLQLYKKDPIADSSDVFNIETMLNENWDKIDVALKQTTDALESIDLSNIPSAEKQAEWNAKASTAVATTSANGLQSAEDKVKLNGIATGAQVNRSQSTQVQATTGTDTTTDMSPARTINAIDSRTRYGVTTGTSTALVLTLSPAPTSLYTGIEVKVKLHVATGANPTLNVNGLGAKALYDFDGARFTGEAGKIYPFVYDGVNFTLVSGGGGEGKLNVYSHSTGYPDTDWSRQGVVIASQVPINKVVTDDNVWSANSFDYNPLAKIPPADDLNSRFDLSISSIGNFIYMSPMNGRNTFYRYNTLDNTWTSLANMPLTRSAAPSIAVNGLVYVFGGQYNSSSTSTLWRYNPQTNTWAELAPAPNGGKYAGITASGTKIYVIAPINVSGYLNNTFMEYDIATNKWKTLPTVPEAGRGFSAALYNNKVYAIGGSVAGNNTKHYAYNLSTNTWSAITIATPQYANFSYLKTPVQVGKYLYVTALFGAKLLSQIDLSTLTVTSYEFNSTYSSPITFSGLGIANNSIYLLGVNRNNTTDSKSDAMYRFNFNPKSYPAGTVIILRTGRVYGKYYTQFISSKKVSGAHSLMETGFDDIFYHNGTDILKNLETYYGNGRSWIRFK